MAIKYAWQSGSGIYIQKEDGSCSGVPFIPGIDQMVGFSNSAVTVIRTSPGSSIKNLYVYDENGSQIESRFIT